MWENVHLPCIPPGWENSQWKIWLRILGQMRPVGRAEGLGRPGPAGPTHAGGRGKLLSFGFGRTNPGREKADMRKEGSGLYGSG